jgi:hypothetical protein
VTVGRGLVSSVAGGLVRAVVVRPVAGGLGEMSAYVSIRQHTSAYVSTR